MARINPNDPRPPYVQIADDLRRMIANGDLAPGQRVASSRDLAASYGVAPMTVHQAMRALRDEGLVDSWQGRGVFVRSDADARPMDLAGQIQSIGEQVDTLVTRVDSTIMNEINEIRRHLGILQAQMMELYAKTGHVYPREEPRTQHDSDTRRRQSSA
jgi:GntR family transcriptional regulator